MTRAVNALPVVAIVGRPNVGKSTLFNRILGTRHAIVEDRARTTRDRLYGDSEWNGRRFIIVDTGGLEIDPNDPIEARVQEQARLAIAEADVIVFVVDAISGITPADLEAAELLRLATAPVLLAVNKTDNDKRELEAAEFYALGWDETYPISAAHGRGTGDLLDALVWALPPESEGEIARKTREAEAEIWARDVADGFVEPFVRGGEADAEDEREDAEDEAGEAGDGTAKPEMGGPDLEARKWDAAIAAEAESAPVAIAIVGRPNVGKSSLLNALLGEERAIVSDIPGTTRDAIDTALAWGRSEVVLIDTAGMRRRGKTANGPLAERYSALRTLRAIARADVAILVLDAVDGLTAQDAHVAGYVVEEGRGLVVAINKWDLLADKTDRTFDEYVQTIRRDVPFLDFAPVVSISAKTGQRVSRALEAAIDVWGERRKRIGTGELNRLIGDAVQRQTPPLVKGKRPKIFYATQAAVAPPTFVLFAREAASVHFSYQRYLENQLREAYGFDGTPIRLIFRERSAVELPPRRKSGSSGGAKSSPKPRPKSGAKPAGKSATKTAGKTPAKTLGKPAGKTAGKSAPKGGANPARPGSKGSRRA
jgi:GTPase